MRSRRLNIRVMWGLVLVVSMALSMTLWAAQEAKAVAEGELQFANLGDLQLKLGGVIPDCQIGYRTLGTLNADKSNVVLWPTWFSGRTADLLQFIGPDKVVDPTKYFVVLVDAIGYGVSSSPSNSKTQPGVEFPEYTIRDMVNSQYRLLTEVLELKSIYAVMGISMGGMQTWEWIVAYPDFMKKAIPTMGTTTQTTYDLLLWETEHRAIELARRMGFPEEARKDLAATVAGIHQLGLVTPDYHNRVTLAQNFEHFMKVNDEGFINNFDPLNWASQLRAMMRHNISANVGFSMEKAAAVVKAKVLVPVSSRDMMVNSGPAKEFAKLIGAEVLDWNSDCGHLSNAICDFESWKQAVGKFLDNK